MVWEFSYVGEPGKLWGRRLETETGLFGVERLCCGGEIRGRRYGQGGRQCWYWQMDQ